jgi:hypothetical protein
VQTFATAADAALFWVEQGVGVAMNKYNRKDQDIKEE